jgi:broad specificity phosphatase PhoE
VSERGAARAARPEASGPAGQASGGGELWLIRHGETEWSRDRKHTGRTDIPLTPHGEDQARALASLLGSRPLALVLVSPRQRAQRTAELAGLLPCTVDEDVAEWDYGEYEGLTTPEIRQGRPGWTIWSGDPPGGETAAQVGARADRVLVRIRAALAQGDVAVVGHGHFSRVLAARWLGLEPAGGRLFALDAAAPCLLDTEHGGPVVHRWSLPNPADDA